MTKRDALLDVFLSGLKKDVFHSVEHRQQIWREDPFDVESVHEPARAQFQRLLTQVRGLERRYGQLVDAGARGADVQEVGWLLEELRVSLFAQQIRTAHPVSEQRIRKAVAAATG